MFLMNAFTSELIKMRINIQFDFYFIDPNEKLSTRRDNTCVCVCLSYHSSNTFSHINIQLHYIIKIQFRIERRSSLINSIRFLLVRSSC